MNRELQGAEADIQSIRKALTVPEKSPRLRRKHRKNSNPLRRFGFNTDAGVTAVHVY